MTGNIFSSLEKGSRLPEEPLNLHGDKNGKEQEPLTKEFHVCDSMRTQLLEEIEQAIRLLSNFDPDYSPEELKGITEKYHLIPRNNIDVVLGELKNMKKKFEDNTFYMNSLRNMNFKLVLSEREPKEADKYLMDGLISGAAQKH
ncbi:MAG TPA: hypothetical protein P5548_02560 [Candidatus Moranbacteria bacterium]|nr:hypothetical protein [Candidatus Moranbacteria bacterium]HRZ33749.1 hypothetical protein [Candidatus Moranbacteria bacterium]